MSLAPTEYRPLLMRANRLLGSALIEHNLVKFEDLEAANERLLEVAASGQVRQSSVLGILVYEKKVMREEDLLHHVVDDHGVGVVDLRGYEVPEEVKKEKKERCFDYYYCYFSGTEKRQKRQSVSLCCTERRFFELHPRLRFDPDLQR